VSAVIGGLLGVVLLVTWLIVAVTRSGRADVEAARAVEARAALVEFANQSLELQSMEQILDFAAPVARVTLGASRTVAFQPGVVEGVWDARLPEQEEVLPQVPAAVRGLFGWLRHNEAIAVRQDLGHARFGAMRGPLGQIMDQYGVDVLLPLVHRGHTLAALGFALGRRVSSLDRELMRQFRLQATQACANVRLHREASHVINLAREVDLASAAQQALVPDTREGACGLISWAGHVQAAGQAGSDFWSAYALDGERVLVIIGDATGTGLAGSMVSAVVKSCCDAIIDARGDRIDPASLLGTLNRALWRPEKPVHMRCFAALFDGKQRALKYASAGHPFPYRLGGKLTVLGGSGPVLGDEPQSRYRLVEAPLGERETVVLYTDGLVKLRDGQGREFGDRRLQREIEKNGGLPATQARNNIVREVTAFRGTTAPEDDLAVVVVGVGVG
jgi:serine phosphatase RsbU (regulator of sigma subunit)